MSESPLSVKMQITLAHRVTGQATIFYAVASSYSGPALYEPKSLSHNKKVHRNWYRHIAFDSDDGRDDAKRDQHFFQPAQFRR